MPTSHLSKSSTITMEAAVAVDDIVQRGWLRRCGGGGFEIQYGTYSYHKNTTVSNCLPCICKTLICEKPKYDPYPYVRCERRGEEEERGTISTRVATLAVISGGFSPTGRCFYSVKVKRGHKLVQSRPCFIASHA